MFVSAWLSGCGGVEIKDAEWCGDVGSAGASCYHTLSDAERDIPKDQWDKERFGMLCTQPENFANWKEAILQLCKQYGRCTFDEQQLIEKNEARVQDFKQKLITP